MKNYSELSSLELIKFRTRLNEEEKLINNLLMDRFSKQSKGINIIPTKPQCSIPTINLKNAASLVIEDQIITKLEISEQTDLNPFLIEQEEKQESLKTETIELLADSIKDVTVFENGNLVICKINGHRLL